MIIFNVKVRLDNGENKYGYEYNVESTTYYDENGNVESILNN
jgi:hypothetical protein